MSAAAIAMNRFGLGARPDDPSPSDPRRWLLAQLDAYQPASSPWQPLPRTPALVEAWLVQQRAVRQAPEGERSGIRQAYLRQGRDAYVAAVGARTDSALQSPTPFVERLVHFWANHFAVSVDKLPIVGLAGGFEFEAIRPHVLGRFEDMLLAVDAPPGDAAVPRSGAVGRPGQPGRAARGASGSSGGAASTRTSRARSWSCTRSACAPGYTQADVTEFARALTGWTVCRRGERRCSAGRRRPSASCRRCTSPARARCSAALRPGRRAAGARDPARPRHARPRPRATSPTKLARHFVADDPPPALVQRLASSVRAHGRRPAERLPRVDRRARGVAASERQVQVAVGLGASRECARSAPRDLADAAGREPAEPARSAASGGRARRPATTISHASWAAPDALLRRVEVAQRIARRAGDAVDARALAPRVLPGALSSDTAGAIARAESAEHGARAAARVARNS